MVFVLQEFHSSQVDARRCRDKVHPKKDKVYKGYQTYSLTLTFCFSFEKQNVKSCQMRFNLNTGICQQRYYSFKHKNNNFSPFLYSVLYFADFQERLAGDFTTFQPCLGAGLGEQGLHQHFCLYGSSERPAGDFPSSSTHPAQYK